MSTRFNVCAMFGERRAMKTAVIYAGKLATLLSAEKLHIYLPGARDVVAPTMASGSAAEVQRRRIKDLVSEWQEHPVEVHDDVDLAVAPLEHLPENCIIVTNHPTLARHDVAVLKPFEETLVLRASGSILVPFGDGDSGTLAASVALPLAKQLSLEVVFYHTTWPSDGVTSEEAHDHMGALARSHYDNLSRMANDADVMHRLAVEMADDVVFGMLHCALNGDVHPEEPAPVNMIVMAHGVNTHIGSYVEKALKVSATPILVVAQRNLHAASPTPEEEADDA